MEPIIIKMKNGINFINTGSSVSWMSDAIYDEMGEVMFNELNKISDEEE